PPRPTYTLSLHDALPICHIEFPAMIGTAQPVLLVAAEPQRHAAVGAEFLDQAGTPCGVAERNQLFRQKLNSHRRTVRLGKLPGRSEEHTSELQSLAYLVC